MTAITIILLLLCGIAGFMVGCVLMSRQHRFVAGDLIIMEEEDEAPYLFLNIGEETHESIINQKEKYVTFRVVRRKNNHFNGKHKT